MDNIDRALRMEIATKQLQIDTLKIKIKRMEDDNNARQRTNTPGEKTKRTSKTNIINK